MNGIPAHTNPFCIIEDQTIDDGVHCGIAPQYFDFDLDRYPSMQPVVNCIAPVLSQEEAEALLHEMFNNDPVGEFAVKEQFAHIIPADLRGKVAVTKSIGTLCQLTDCFA